MCYWKVLNLNVRKQGKKNKKRYPETKTGKLFIVKKRKCKEEKKIGRC